MHYLLILCLFWMTSLQLKAQINEADSSVQVVAYWQMEEELTYGILQTEMAISEVDTTIQHSLYYEVNRRILDSTESSYKTKWSYDSFYIYAPNDLKIKSLKLGRDAPLMVQTDEFGQLEKVLNWQKVRAVALDTTSYLKGKYGTIPSLAMFIEALENDFHSEAAIKNNVLWELQHYHLFYATKLKLNEVYDGDIRMPNPFGAQSLQAQVRVYLADFDIEKRTYEVRAVQRVEQEGLRNSYYGYMQERAHLMGEDVPTWEDLADMQLQIFTVTLFDEAGRLIESNRIRTLLMGNTKQLIIEEIFQK